MVNPELDNTFHALANPTRRAILARLALSSMRVTEVAADHNMSLNAVSKHIKVLEGCGLIIRRIEGRDHFLSLEAGPMAEAHLWLDHYRGFWAERLSNLKKLVEGRADLANANTTGEKK